MPKRRRPPHSKLKSGVHHSAGFRINSRSLVAAPEGIERLQAVHPDCTIVCASIDRGLDERGFIVPGLGDAGDRLYGTR